MSITIVMVGEFDHDIKKVEKYPVYAAWVHIHGVRDCRYRPSGSSGGTVFSLVPLFLCQEFQADGSLV